MTTENTKYYSASFGWIVAGDSISQSWEEYEKKYAKVIEQDVDGYLTPAMSPIEDAAAWEVDKFVEGKLKALKIDYRHAYLFPDRSCYKHIRSTLPIEVLRQRIEAVLADGPWDVYLENLREKSGDDESIRGTIAQRFEEKETA